MALLVEQSLPIPKVRGSNPVIGKNVHSTFTVNCIEKTRIEKKRPGMAHCKKFNTTLKQQNTWAIIVAKMIPTSELRISNLSIALKR